MTCSEVLEVLLDLDNDEGVPPAVEHHLADCPACRREAALLRAAFDAVREEPGSAEAGGSDALWVGLARHDERPAGMPITGTAARSPAVTPSGPGGDLTERIMAAVRADVAASGAVADVGIPLDVARAALSDGARRAAGETERPVPFRNWLTAGLFIVGSLFGLQFSRPFDFLRDAIGPSIDLAIALSLGLFLTVYLCLLVGSNLGKVERWFRMILARTR